MYGGSRKVWKTTLLRLETTAKLFNDMELTKSKAHNLLEFTQYVPNTVLSKTILKKITGNIVVTSFAVGEEMLKKISPFDIYAQIIDGVAELMIEDEIYSLKAGEFIIIPAHAPHSLNAAKQFKMLTTIIKSGYEN